jgi:hypothetical protein
VKTLVRLPLQQGFWMFVCLAVYAVSVSGSIYCVIRDECFMAVSQSTGKVTLFSEGARTQLFGEGLVVACKILLTFT